MRSPSCLPLCAGCHRCGGGKQSADGTDEVPGCASGSSLFKSLMSESCAPVLDVCSHALEWTRIGGSLGKKRCSCLPVKRDGVPATRPAGGLGGWAPARARRDEAARAASHPLASRQRGRLPGRPDRRALGRAASGKRRAQPRGVRFEAAQDPSCGSSGRADPRRPPGYMLRVGFEELDLHRFERLLEEGRRALATHAPEPARQKLSEALSLWRGSPLGDLAFEPFAQVEVERLEELRLAALEERIEAELALAQNEALVPELQALIVQHPLRERLRGQLMLALYRSGRQAEALQVYREARGYFVEELGLEPGPSLKTIEQAILRQEAVLDAPTRDAGGVAVLVSHSPPPSRSLDTMPIPATEAQSRRRQQLLGVAA